MRSLALLALCACTPKDDTAAANPVDTQDSGGRDCAPVEAEPGTTAEGHPSDGWRWEKRGALFGDAEAFAYNEGDLAPTLADTGEGLQLLFMRKLGVEQELWASSSSDGSTWTEPVPVTGLEAGEGDYPSLLYEQGVYRLWYGSGAIDMATSSDGLGYEPGETALRPGESGSFDGLSLLYPHATRDGDALDLYYTGYDGLRFAIGLARSEDEGSSWSAGELLLERDSEGWDNTSVAMPMALEHEGERLLWYGGYDTSQTDPGPWRIGTLSPEGQRRVSLPLAESGLDAWSTRDPAVIPWEDGWLMVYAGMGDDGAYRLLSASSDVCN